MEWIKSHVTLLHYVALIKTHSSNYQWENQSWLTWHIVESSTDMFDIFGCRRCRWCPLQVDPKLAQIRQLQDELWKLEGPSAEEIQAAKAAAQKVPGSRRSEMIGRWLGWGYGVGQCEANWMVQDGFRCVISQDMSGYGGIAVPFNILEPAALRHNWCTHAGGRGPFPKVEGVESSIRGMQMPVSCHRVPIYIYTYTLIQLIY